jgi:hypothetical protein
MEPKVRRDELTKRVMAGPDTRASHHQPLLFLFRVFRGSSRAQRSIAKGVWPVANSSPSWSSLSCLGSSCLSLSYLILFLLAAPLHADERAAFFETRIRPVLMETCLTCHGGDKTSNGLRVDAIRHLTDGGETGVAVVPGKPHESLLITAIHYADTDLQMPPSKRLPDRVINDFDKWVADGAYWPTAEPKVDVDTLGHWAFQPLTAPDKASDASTSLHTIDRFLDVAHREHELRVLSAADRQTLIRRAAFDLTGLAPTPDDVQEFLSDEQPGAFIRTVDRMLDSPRYAERWARHWLDLVRYADTAGDDSDYPIPQAILYRDYVIDSFAADKPYDQFIQEQIAGDILARECAPEDFRERTIATGFLAQAKRFATGKHEDMHLIIEDTLHTIGQSVLGLTFRCARCHDHKYDPLSQQDYYALYGFFKSTVYPHPGGESDRQPSDLIPLVSGEDFAQSESAYLAKFGDRIAELEAEIKQIESKTADRKERRALTQPLRSELAETRRQSPWVTTPLAYAVKEGTFVDARIQLGGDPARLQETVPRGIPEFLAPDRSFEVSEGQSGRLDLARWLTDPNNPLTSRVMVNRIWQHHFGNGIVATPSNFGIQGDPPTHPELLDWLAAQFVDSGWSIKAMHRLIMSSAAYQRSSGLDDASHERDPDNRFYWRFNRRRLDAESIRDSMLWIAGNLDTMRPGPHAFPATDTWRFSAHRQFKAVYPSNHRSIYLMVQRLHPHPFLSLFNGPNTTASVAVRDESTLPLQALFMSNSEFVHTQARGVARRLIQSEASQLAQVDRVYWLTVSRPASQAELDRGHDYLRQYAQLLVNEADLEEQEKLDGRAVEPLASLIRTLFASNEFVYID